DRPLTPGGSRPLDAVTAHAIGLLDAVLPAEEFRQGALVWVSELVRGRIALAARPVDPSAEELRDAAAAARERMALSGHDLRPSAPLAVDLVIRSYERSKDEAFAAEDEA